MKQIRVWWSDSARQIHASDPEPRDRWDWGWDEEGHAPVRLADQVAAAIAADTRVINEAIIRINAIEAAWRCAAAITCEVTRMAKEREAIRQLKARAKSFEQTVL